MTNRDLNWIANYIWGIADDVLRDLYQRGKYRDVILPMTVLRRLDAVGGRQGRRADMKDRLDEAGVVEQDATLRQAAGQAFHNTSRFTLGDLRARASRDRLEADFRDYLDGFSPNVRDILNCFEFRNQIPKLSRADVLGSLIEKVTSADINLVPEAVRNADGSIRHPGLDNHGMGSIFEELVRRFNEENNEAAGEHWTPRDAVKLMAKLIFMPIADEIQSGTCLTGIATYVWVLTNRKPERRRGKVQLIDATGWFKPLRKNPGKKNRELGDDDIDRICSAFLNFEETERSRIFDNAAFGYWKVTVERPLRIEGIDPERAYKASEIKKLREHGQRSESAPAVIKRIHKRGTGADPLRGRFEATIGGDAAVVEYEPDSALRDAEQIPLQEAGGIEAFLRREVLPYAADAWHHPERVRIGYEISFNRYFHQPEPMRSLDEIRADRLTLEKETAGLLDDFLMVREPADRPHRQDSTGDHRP